MYLDTEIAAEGNVVRLLREEIAGGKGSCGGAFEHDLALLPVEIGGDGSQIEFGEERSLEHGVDAVNGAEIGFLNLVVQDSSVARSLHGRSRFKIKTLISFKNP